MKLTATPLGSTSQQPSALLRAIQSVFVYRALTLSAVFSFTGISLADEGGVSFWLPGQFGSLAATPQQPGWSAAWIYYHTTVAAGGDVALSRQFEIGNIPANLSAHVNANLNSTGDLGFFIPSYVFATPVFGGRAAVSVRNIWQLKHLLGWDGGGHTRWNAVRSTVHQYQQLNNGFRRFVSAVRASLEQRRQQLHDIHHRRCAGRRLQLH